MSNHSSFTLNRERMIEEHLLPRGITDPRVIEAMREVPRHSFVEEALQTRAYGDHPLPIGQGQTISQPFIVALMTQALHLSGEEKVLEIGTGSGYQTAILSRLCERVYTVERLSALLSQAKKIFDRLRYHNITARMDDGTVGWPEHAPYDAIIVTAGGPTVPTPLLQQLADPGRMVIPVGDQQEQELRLIEKDQGKIRVKVLERVRFVDLIGEYGWLHERYDKKILAAKTL